MLKEYLKLINVKQKRNIFARTRLELLANISQADTVEKTNSTRLSNAWKELITQTQLKNRRFSNSPPKYVDKFLSYVTKLEKNVKL